MGRRMSKKQRKFTPSYWIRSDAKKDANEDSRLKGVPLQFFNKLCDSYNWKNGYAECSRSFVTDRVPISRNGVIRAERKLVDQGRVTILRKGTGRASTRYGINWYYRGADRIRANNGGQPIHDCRVDAVEVPKGSSVVVPTNARSHEPDGTTTAFRGAMVAPKPFSSSEKKEEKIAMGDVGAPAFRPAPVAMAGWTWTPAADAWEGVVTHLVQIVASEIVAGEGGGHDMLLTLNTYQGTPAGTLRIHLEHKDSRQAEAGQAHFSLLRCVLNVGDIRDTSELHDAQFLLSIRGDLIPDPENAGAMEHQISGLFREADILTGLARLAGAPRRFRNDQDTRAMNADVLAELRRLRAVSMQSNMKEAA